MYCIDLSEDDIQLEEVKEFIIFIRSSFSGDLLKSAKIKRPSIFPPVLKFQYDINNKDSADFRNIKEDIINLLDEVYIYVGGDDPSSSLNGINVFQQFDYCKSTEGNYLAYQKLKYFINSLKDCHIINLNLVGGNIFTHPDLNILIDDFNKLPFNKSIYASYKDIPTNFKKNPFLNDSKYTIRVLIDFPISQQILFEAIQFLIDNNCRFESLFAITSAIEFEIAEAIIDKLELEHVEIKPVYTGENIDFFKKYIFLSEKDLLSSKITRKEIFINQSMNISNFGKIRIMTNGEVYSDLNNHSIGDINTPLLNLIYNAMRNPKEWMRIRNQKPCNRCIYQWICPSPSGYEHAIGKNNLCTVKRDPQEYL